MWRASEYSQIACYASREEDASETASGLVLAWCRQRVWIWQAIMQRSFHSHLNHRQRQEEGRQRDERPPALVDQDRHHGTHDLRVR